MSDPLEIRIRPLMGEADRAYVYSTWLRSYRANGDAVRGVPSDAFFDAHHGLIESALQRGSVLVACAPDAEDTIYGWLSWERGEYRDTVHYCYTKQRFRRWRVARRLLAAADLADRVDYTHRTRALAGLVLPDTWQYNPYAFLVGPRSAANDSGSDKGDSNGGSHAAA